MTSVISTPRISQQLPSLERLTVSGWLSDQEALTLVDVDGEGMGELCSAAAELRDRGRGRVITFSPKVFIPLTRLCRDFCGYCTFRQSPDEADKLFLSSDAVLSVAKAGERLGCTEALFTLGERPEQRYAEAGQWLDANGIPHDAELSLRDVPAGVRGNGPAAPRQSRHHEPAGIGGVAAD